MFLYKQHTEFVGTRRVQSGVRLSFKRSFRHCLSIYPEGQFINTYLLAEEMLQL